MSHKFRIAIAVTGLLALAVIDPSVLTAQQASGPTVSATVPTSVPPPIVGGAPMLPTANIMQNVAAASNLTTMVELLNRTNLAATLAGAGPYTVFAPANAGFAALPANTLSVLKRRKNSAVLSRILSYHIVPGALTVAELKRRIAAGGGTATLTTIAEVPLTVQLFPIAAGGETLVLTGANGGKSYVTIVDVTQANGVMHVVNGVLSPDP